MIWSLDVDYRKSDEGFVWGSSYQNCHAKLIISALRPNPVYLSSLRVIVAGIVRVRSLLIPKKKPVGYALRVRP